MYVKSIQLFKVNKLGVRCVYFPTSINLYYYYM